MVQFQTPKQSFNPSYSDNLDFRSFIETVYRSAFFGDPNFSREVALMQTYVSRSELLRNSNAVAQEFQFLILNSLKGLIKGIISKALKVNVEIDFIPNDLAPYLLDSFRENFQISEVTQCGAYKPYSVDAVQTTVCFISRVADDEVRVLINPAVLFSLEDRYLNDYFDTLLKELRRLSPNKQTPVNSLRHQLTSILVTSRSLYEKFLARAASDKRKQGFSREELKILSRAIIYMVCPKFVDKLQKPLTTLLQIIVKSGRDPNVESLEASAKKCALNLAAGVKSIDEVLENAWEGYLELVQKLRELCDYGKLAYDKISEDDARILGLAFLAAYVLVKLVDVPLSKESVAMTVFRDLYLGHPNSSQSKIAKEEIEDDNSITNLLQVANFLMFCGEEGPHSDIAVYRELSRDFTRRFGNLLMCIIFGDFVNNFEGIFGISATQAWVLTEYVRLAFQHKHRLECGVKSYWSALGKILRYAPGNLLILSLEELMGFVERGLISIKDVVRFMLVVEDYGSNEEIRMLFSRLPSCEVISVENGKLGYQFQFRIGRTTLEVLVITEDEYMRYYLPFINGEHNPSAHSRFSIRRNVMRHYQSVKNENGNGPFKMR